MPAMDAIILAAGASSRMGRPKALLLRRGQTFLARAIQAARCSGALRVLVVVAPPHADLLAGEVERWGGQVVRNPNPELGQVRSMAVGLEAARGAAALIAPVDVPDWNPATGALLLAAAGDAVHIPIFGGTRGHPIRVPLRLAAALHDAQPDESARDVFARLRVPQIQHAVEDPGVLLDVDTPAEYARLEAR